EAFTSVLINQTQPLQAPPVAGTVEDEVPGPNVVLAPRRAHVTGVRALAVRPAGPGIGPGAGQFQPRLSPVAAHRLLVDRPPFAVQEGPDPPVSVPRVRAGELLDPPRQRHPFVPHDGRVPEAGPRQAQRPRRAALRYAKMITYLGDDQTASGASHGFFFKASCNMRRSSASSATSSLSRPTSASSPETRSCSAVTGFSWRAFQR